MPLLNQTLNESKINFKSLSLFIIACLLFIIWLLVIIRQFYIQTIRKLSFNQSISSSSGSNSITTIPSTNKTSFQLTNKQLKNIDDEINLDHLNRYLSINKLKNSEQILDRNEMENPKEISNSSSF